ncbi:MAG: PIG-L family deacetylase [Acidobacteria bacterium]|nr:PIG-L family deacetylase [Acidobacteriota bacterium]
MKGAKAGPSILFCFAHPDDESFSGSGTAMKYAARGMRTVLVTATLGERGKTGEPPLCSADQLPAVREHELREAAAIIGFDELHLLGYRDRALADAKPEDIRRTLVSIIRCTRPAVALTFDPNGFNVHPDHVAISRFTSDAIAAAADPRWHVDAGEPHAVARLLWTPPNPPWELAPRESEATAAPPVHDMPGIDFVLDVSQWRDRRAAALRAHRTQHLSIDRYFFNQPNVDRILDREFWRHAWGPPLTSRPADDILAGCR